MYVNMYICVLITVRYLHTYDVHVCRYMKYIIYYIINLYNNYSELMNRLYIGLSYQLACHVTRPLSDIQKVISNKHSVDTQRRYIP